MSAKNMAEVVIGGKVYRISGCESTEYLHQIAVYINEKQLECAKLEDYRKQSSDQRELLLNMNLADDFFKAKKQAEKLSEELKKKERELYSVRHELVEAQLALENQKAEAAKKETQRPAAERPQRSRQNRGASGTGVYGGTQGHTAYRADEGQ